MDVGMTPTIPLPNVHGKRTNAELGLLGWRTVSTGKHLRTFRKSAASPSPEASSKKARSALYKLILPYNSRTTRNDKTSQIIW